MMGQYIHDSKVINERFDCHYINLTTAKSLQDIGKGGVKKLWRFFCLLLRIVKEQVRVKPQLVYVTPNSHGGAFYKDFVVVQLIKLMGYRVIVHYHNKGVATRQDRWLDDKLYRLFFKNIKVILLAEALYGDVEKYVKREDVFVCPNGIPESLKGEPTAERNNVIPQLLFLSNLLVDKGVLVLLDALKILKEKGYSFVCHFVGGETAEIDAARFADEVRSRGLDKMVLYLGKKYGEEKKEEYGNADVFVFPSLDEAFPLVNLEAMEFKLPVVASDVGGVTSEVVDGENGFICKPGDTEAFVDSIGKLLEDSDLRKKMGEAGYKRFKENFTLKVFENHLAKGIGGGKLALAYFHGKKFGEEKSYFFEHADIFVFPSCNEAFGLVSLEAMEHKLPVVATDEGGIPDIVKDGENGLIASKRDSKSLAACLERLLSDKTLRERMGEDGYRKFKTHFTLDAFEQKFADCLDIVTHRGGELVLAYFHGKKFGEEKNYFFEHADIFVFPTYYYNECFPLVLLEAMERAVPCISTREGGVSAIIDEGMNGFMVERRDANVLADRIEFLLTHPKERTRMGIAGRQRFKNEFTLSKFETRMKQILELANEEW